MTYFCTQCFKEVDEFDESCCACGTKLIVDRRTYEHKLIGALRHRLPDRQVMAAQILGRLRSRSAVPHLARLVKSRDPYLASAAVEALARIGTTDAVEFVRAVAKGHSVIVRATAQSALELAARGPSPRVADP